MVEQGKLSMWQNQQRRQLQAIAQFKMQRRQENLARRAAGGWVVWVGTCRVDQCTPGSVQLAHPSLAGWLSCVIVNLLLGQLCSCAACACWPGMKCSRHWLHVNHLSVTAVRCKSQLISTPSLLSVVFAYARVGAGEEPLAEDPPEGMFKPVAEPNQLDNMLLSNQMASYCQHINSATQQALSKLTLMEGLQKAL